MEAQQYVFALHTSLPTARNTRKFWCKVPHVFSILVKFVDKDFVSSIVFHENPSTGSHADTYGQTEDLSNLSQLEPLAIYNDAPKYSDPFWWFDDKRT